MIVFCGVGFFEENLLNEIIKHWEVTVIEKDKNKIDKLQSAGKNITLTEGDATSAVLWKKLDTEGIESVIVTFRDSDLSLEVCWIVRNILKLDVPIIVLLYEKEGEKKFEDSTVTLIKPMDISINIILNKLHKNYSRAIDIGQKKGEIIELNVMSKSHITDRKLKNLRPSKWHLAAIYRNNELVIPSGSTRIKVGDRIVVAGEPKILENLAGIFSKGIPQFPLQYGEDMAVALDKRHSWVLEESVFLNAAIRTNNLRILIRDSQISDELKNKLDTGKLSYKIEEENKSKIRFVENKENAGIHALSFNRSNLFDYIRAREIFKSAEKPIFISRNSSKYEKVIISLNCFDPVYPMETGVEVARLFNIDFEVIYVTLPKGMRGDAEEIRLDERRNLVKDFGNLYRKKIPYKIMEGNPIVQTLEYLGSTNGKILYISSFKKGSAGSLLKPEVGFYTAFRSEFSSIVIPQKVENE
ncbi:TrkA-C domain protein [Flexistipes sinusarabici DSM 4947]|uniref:TrkA-C domain protein n=1 Tax=Flexistipes sinusarabici (strain ATCC 49648 / DSM 4947 / MAS 10) TaxID=717231 RepID=F8E9N1_FLESM|nr:NAD-binding protein [Flexistipes sinusarabici]AEI14214.1 TrkA-C domain protein [Flexistipes sinusarabici DSM 4947]